MSQFVEHLNVTDIDQINRTTPKEFEYLMKGAQLREVKRLDAIHKQSWSNKQVQATKNNGKTPAFKTYDKFFDFEKTRDDVLYAEVEKDKEKQESQNLHLIAQRVQELG